MNGKKLLAIVCLLASSTIPAGAQGLLPGAFAGWTAATPGEQVSANQVEQLVNDKAAVLREYGITSVERRDYEQGKKTATVTVYRMVDPSAAFGTFTYLRNPQMTALAGTVPAPYTAGARERALVVLGNLVLDVSSPKERPTDADLKALVAVLASRADQRPFPTIGEFLPMPGLTAGSERYALGPLALADVFPSGSAIRADWVGFHNSAEAIVARYRLPGQQKKDDAVLLIALYPTQQLAADEYNALSKWFALNADPSQANGRPAIFGTRSGSLVALLSGVESRATASNLLNQIHYGSAVTWNEPTHELTDPPISTMIVGAFLDTGSILLLAIAAGIGFGGFRILVKFFLPGRVFDRNEQLEILQLGLTSKPISAKDFYTLKSSNPD